MKALGIRLIILLPLVWLITGCVGPKSQVLEPFTTDGCSLFPDDKILSCCTDHDIDYWQGGDALQRKQVDLRFRSCVLEISGSEALSELAYRGVRIGGNPYLPPSAGWGYGWAFGRGYKALSPGEWIQIKAEMTARLHEFELKCAAGDQRSCNIQTILARRPEFDQTQ